MTSYKYRALMNMLAREQDPAPSTWGAYAGSPTSSPSYPSSINGNQQQQNRPNQSRYNLQQQGKIGGGDHSNSSSDDGDDIPSVTNLNQSSKSSKRAKYNVCRGGPVAPYTIAPDRRRRPTLRYEVNLDLLPKDNNTSDDKLVSSTSEHRNQEDEDQQQRTTSTASSDSTSRCIPSDTSTTSQTAGTSSTSTAEKVNIDDDAISTVFMSSTSSSTAAKKTENMTFESLRAAFVPSFCDNETKSFIERARNPSMLKAVISGALEQFLSRTTANSITNRGGMFVLSTERAQALLGPALFPSHFQKPEKKDIIKKVVEVATSDEDEQTTAEGASASSTVTTTTTTTEQSGDGSSGKLRTHHCRHTTLIDIGAGDGGVTAKLQPFFSSIYATEFSTGMQWRLWQRGYTVLQDPFVLPTTTATTSTLATSSSSSLSPSPSSASSWFNPMSWLRNSNNSSSSSDSIYNGQQETAEDTPSVICGHGDYSDAMTTTTPRSPSEAGGYDCVALLNVLDRADTPLTLLNQMKEITRKKKSPTANSNSMPSGEPTTTSENSSTSASTSELSADSSDDLGGCCLLAVVFPWCPFVEDGPRQRMPSETLPMDDARCQDNPSFEHCVATFTERVLWPMGFEVVRWTRVPYLCEGNHFTEYFALDDAVFVLRPV